MNIYFGLSREQTEEACKKGRRIASKPFTEGDSGWCEDESPDFNWEEFDYAVMVKENEAIPIIDVCTDPAPLAKGEITISFDPTKEPLIRLKLP